MCFADDCMIFFCGNLASVRTLLAQLEIFADSFGLVANSSKSDVYSCKIPFRSISFRYLGVPLSSKRLSAVECEHLFLLFWWISQAFRVKFLCCPRRCLSGYMQSIGGEADSNAPRNMNWARVCTPKNLGGLGIQNLEVWNFAAVGKVVWHISFMNESMGVRWWTNLGWFNVDSHKKQRRRT